MSAGRYVRPGPPGAESGFSSLGARIEQRAWASPRPWRRRAGSVALPGGCASGGWIGCHPRVSTSPRPVGFSSCPLQWGCGKGRPRTKRWASGAGPLSSSSGPGEGSWSSLCKALHSFPRARRGLWGYGAWAAWGRWWAASEVSRRVGMIIFCSVTRKVRSQRGGWCMSSREGWFPGCFQSGGGKID